MLNPVLRRELRTVLRTWKTFTVLMLYVLFMTAVAGIFVWGMFSGSYRSGFNPQSAMALYPLLTSFQLGLIMLIVPALTGGSISGERERQTLDLMLVTKMSAFTIITGKLISSLILTILMIAASMPVYAVLLFYGGVSIIDMAAMLLFSLCIALLTGSLAMFYSVVFKKTVIAIVITYVTLMILSIGTIVLTVVTYQFGYSESVNNMYSTGTMTPPKGADIINFIMFFTMALNPFTGHFALLDEQLGMSLTNRVLTSFIYSGAIPEPPNMLLYNIIVNIVFIILLNVLSALMLKPVRRSRKYR